MTGLTNDGELRLGSWLETPGDARALLQHCRDAGETLVLTTATNRMVSELTAANLGVDHYICTELEQLGGRFTGRTTGTPNMRKGKIDRLQAWLRDLDRILHADGIDGDARLFASAYEVPDGVTLDRVSIRRLHYEGTRSKLRPFRVTSRTCLLAVKYRYLSG